MRWWKMHPPVFKRQFSEPLSSTDYFLQAIKGTADTVLQRHFSFFKTYRITPDEMNECLLAANAFELGDYNYIKMLPNNAYKMEKLLKRVIKKGRKHCYLLLKVLCKLGHNDLITVITPPEDCVPLPRYQRLTAGFLELHKRYISSMIQINTVLDMLYEREVLTTRDHDRVQEKKPRSEKKETLLNILFDKQNVEWVPIFVRILWITGHIEMLDELARQVDRVQDALQPIHLGNTIPYQQYIIHLANVNIPHQPINPYDIGEEVDEILTAILDSEVVDLWEGSIYFLLNSASPKVLEEIIQRKDDKRIVEFLERLFQSNIKLREQFGTDKVIKFELQRENSISFLRRKYGKSVVLDRKNHTEDCIDCFQATVIGNYSTVMDEIEDDIIRDTMDRMKDLPPYLREKYLAQNKNRMEMSMQFLQFILANENALSIFKDVFAFRSEVSLTPCKCKICKPLTDKSEQVQNTDMTFLFTISMDTEGKVLVSEVKDVKEEIYTKGQSDLISLRKLKRSQSAHRFCIGPNSKTDKSEMMRLIVFENTTTPKTFIKHLQKKFIVCPIPAFNKDKYSEENRTNYVAECVARTSPGPHAFIVLSYIDDLEDVYEAIKTYERNFGDNFWNYLVPVVVTDEHRHTATEDIKSILSENFLDKRHFVVTNENTSTNELHEMLNYVIKLMLKDNNTEHFSNEIFEASEKHIQQEAKLIEDIMQQKIWLLEEKLKDLKNVNPREKATSELTDVFLRTVNKYVSFRCN